MNTERGEILNKRVDAIKEEFTFGNRAKAFKYLTEIIKELINEQVGDKDVSKRKPSKA